MDQAKASAIPPPAPDADSRTRPGEKGRRGSPRRAREPQFGPALLLACGNTLRQDDGVGWRVAEAVEKLIPPAQLRVVTVQQFTPELAAEIAGTELAIFVDASAVDEPGSIRMVQIEEPRTVREAPLETHRLDPPALIALARELCGHAPRHAFLLTMGASQFGYGEALSRTLEHAVPRAVRLLASVVAAFAARP